jgi:3-hydroxyacyl-[acyl-carrier-protein] dehydratase
MSEINNEIFIIESLEHGAGQVTANLSINKSSAIFEGHFPGQPVVPGDCMVQLVKDILQDALNIKVMLKKAATIKFIAMITPDTVHPINLTIGYKIIDDGYISINAKILTGDVTCFKLQGNYSKL